MDARDDSNRAQELVAQATNVHPLEGAAVGLFALSVAAVAYTGSVFPEFRPWAAALGVVASLQVARLFMPEISGFALVLAWLVTIVAIAAVLLTLLAGTIGGSFHVDEPIQPVLWSLAAVGVSGLLLAASRWMAARGADT